MSGNSSGGCGGVAGRTVTVTDSTIRNNFADSGTGGICATTATVTRSTITGNGGGEGCGGLSGSTLMLVDSTVTGNGNGIVADRMTAINSTITENTANAEFGGAGGYWTDTLVLKNTIVAGNSGPIRPGHRRRDRDQDGHVVGIPKGRTLADILDPAGLADHGGPQTIALVDAFDNPALEFGAASIAHWRRWSTSAASPSRARPAISGRTNCRRRTRGQGFTDIAASPFRWDIESFWAAGITKGCTVTTFCPTATVTRGQMAAFLDRALKLPSRRPTTSPTTRPRRSRPPSIAWQRAD